MGGAKVENGVDSVSAEWQARCSRNLLITSFGGIRKCPPTSQYIPHKSGGRFCGGTRFAQAIKLHGPFLLIHARGVGELPH